MTLCSAISVAPPFDLQTPWRAGAGDGLLVSLCHDIVNRFAVAVKIPNHVTMDLMQQHLLNLSYVW